MRTIKVAIAGLGVVGNETARLLQSNKDIFTQRLGTEIDLVAVADRDVNRQARRLGLPASVIKTTDPQKLLNIPGLDIIIETLGGIDAPKALTLGALGRGLRVVTSNKRLLSECWDQIQSAGGGGIRFEASVAGGIPVIEALDTSLSGNRISAVYGILNGTTNFILTRMGEGQSLKEALALAQSRGFAEKDPTLDVSGLDTAHKISVLASLLTGSALPPGRIDRAGILSLSREDLIFAQTELGRTARLLGTLKIDWNKEASIEAHVFPTLVPLAHPLAAVRDEFNAVLIKASSAGDLMFYGRGAGAGPTASAVIGDVFLTAREITGSLPPHPSFHKHMVLKPAEQSRARFYLRLQAQDKPGVLAHVTAALSTSGLSIATIHQPEPTGRAGVPVILTTHEATQGAFNRALKEILALPAISRQHTVLRILD